MRARGSLPGRWRPSARRSPRRRAGRAARPRACRRTSARRSRADVRRRAGGRGRVRRSWTSRPSISQNAPPGAWSASDGAGVDHPARVDGAVVPAVRVAADDKPLLDIGEDRAQVRVGGETRDDRLVAARSGVADQDIAEAGDGHDDGLLEGGQEVEPGARDSLGVPGRGLAPRIRLGGVERRPSSNASTVRRSALPRMKRAFRARSAARSSRRARGRRPRRPRRRAPRVAGARSLPGPGPARRGAHGCRR
jgi:hypothetical protein